MSSMKCVIPGVHLKVFGRAIQSLSKIGDELYFEPLDEGLSLRTVNSSRSAYACFQFAPSFFITYMTGDDDNSSTEDGHRCKLTMKSVMNVFRSLPTIDKTVEKCKITLNMAEDKLIFEMCCRHGIVKTHNLSFMDSETLQAIFSRDSCPNKLTAGPKLLCDAVLNFQANQEEVTLILRPDYIALKNYVEDEPYPSRVIHTELTLSPDEFDNFQVGTDADVTFCLKEFRAILAFGDLTNLPLNIHIEAPGRPITFSITSDLSFEANFVLATLASVDDAPDMSQPETSRLNGRHPSNSSVHNSNRKQASRHQKAHSSSNSLRGSHRTEADHDDDDDEMAMMDINDTTVLEPPSKSRPKPVEPPRKHDHSTNRISVSDTNNNNGVNQKTNTIRDNRLERRNASENSTANMNASSQSRLIPGRNVGCYVSASEESQNESEMERGRGERCSRSLIAEDDNVDISQIIPIRNETQLDGTVSNPSNEMAEYGENEGEDDDEEEEETICATPPSKRFRSIFFSTQSSTQSTILSQKKPAVLCPDSDSED